MLLQMRLMAVFNKIILGLHAVYVCYSLFKLNRLVCLNQNSSFVYIKNTLYKNCEIYFYAYECLVIFKRLYVVCLNNNLPSVVHRKHIQFSTRYPSKSCELVRQSSINNVHHYRFRGYLNRFF